MLALVPTLLLAMTPIPACGAGALEACRELLLAEINRERRIEGLEAVEFHPVLDKIAAERAREVASGGSVDPNMARLRSTTRRYYREGYDPHHWTESALIGRWGEDVFAQWREVEPRWYGEVRAGDYEHVGIGVERWGAQPVFTLVFGLTKRTMEWRLAEPLADLEGVRAVMVREVNERRAAKGRGALRAHPLLDVAAQRHAEDMVRRAYYDHRSPDGETVGTRVRDAGYGKPRMVSENIAKGLFSPAEVVERWMASSGHREGILNHRVTEVGSGVAFGENSRGFEVLWVQVFAKPGDGKR